MRKEEGAMTNKKNQSNKTTEVLPSSSNKNGKRLALKMLPLLLLFTLAILTVLYFMSSLSRVELLSVSGNEEVTDQEIVNSSEVHSGEPLWRTYFSKNEIEENIEKNLPQVKTAELAFSGLNDFEFTVSEWKTVAYLSEDEQYYKILENGVILEEPQSVSIGNMPIFTNFSEGEVMNRLLDEFSKLDPSIHNLISEVNYAPSETNEFLVHIYMNDGNQVLASIPAFSERLQYYPAMQQSVDGEKGVFDLEAGAYFVPFEEKEDEQSDSETNESDEESNL